MRNRTSDFRIPRSDALPLSHRDSTVSEVYYEVHNFMTRVLHTARISNVDSVMFLDRNKREIEKDVFFVLSRAWEQIFLITFDLIKA